MIRTILPCLRAHNHSALPWQHQLEGIRVEERTAATTLRRRPIWSRGGGTVVGAAAPWGLI
jgi:hypothetical protein